MKLRREPKAKIAERPSEFKHFQFQDIWKVFFSFSISLNPKRWKNLLWQNFLTTGQLIAYCGQLSYQDETVYIKKSIISRKQKFQCCLSDTWLARGGEARSQEGISLASSAINTSCQQDTLKARKEPSLFPQLGRRWFGQNKTTFDLIRC